MHGRLLRAASEAYSRSYVEEELSHDVARLAAQWEAIERRARSATAPELLYSEPDLTIRVVRDIFNEDFTKLVIASDNEWDLVDEYVRYVAPNLADRLERWTDEASTAARTRPPPGNSCPGSRAWCAATRSAWWPRSRRGTIR